MKYNILVWPLFMGFMLALALPTWNYSFLIWVAYIPLFVYLLRPSDPKQKFVGASAALSIFFITLLAPLTTLNTWPWLSRGDTLFDYRLALFVVFIVALGILVAIVYAGALTLTCKRAWALPIVFVLLEVLREHIVFGFGWGEAAYSLAPDKLVLPLAHYLSIHGLSFVILLVNLLLALAFVRESRRTTYCVLALALFLVIHVPARSSAETAPSVAIIHSSISGLESTGVEGFERKLNLLRTAEATGAKYVLTPENFFNFLTIDEATSKPLGYEKQGSLHTLFDELVQTTSSSSITLLGAHSTRDGLTYNSLLAIRNGQILGVYHKRALLPLSEQDYFTSGRGAGLTLGVHLGVLICSEISIPSLPSRNADFIVSPSNDSVFDSPLAGRQAQAQAILRAAEARKYLFRSTIGGTSAIISPFGEILSERSPIDLSGVLFIH